MSQPSDFEQLLQAAADQAEPQRLLFVFARADLPDRASPEERDRFLAGKGGALTPLICVDKAPADLTDFDSLLAESRRAGPPWQVVFAAALSGAAGRRPTEAQVGPALEKMVNAIWVGRVDRFAAFDSAGASIQFS